jgi:tetratricopeptide (TPR) repeat protein
MTEAQIWQSASESGSAAGSGGGSGTAPEEAGEPGGADAGAAAGGAAPGGRWRRWRQVWQAPGVALAVGALVFGLVYAARSSPSPDFDGLLGAAEKQIEAQDFDAALATLNESVAPWADDPSFNRGRRQRFHTLRARAIYLGQNALGLSQPQNFETVAKEYREAERLEARLAARDVFFLATSLVELDDYDRARARARSLPDDERDRRNALLRLMVERKLRERQLDAPGALDIIAEFLEDPALTVDDRAWAESQQAKLLARRGDYEEIVHRLLRSLPRLVRASPEFRGELMLRLGEAYLHLGALDEAQGNLELAQKLLPGFGDEPGQAAVLLGRLDELRGAPDMARERYQGVYERFGVSPVGLNALLGMAEVEATLGADDRAAELYTELVDALLGAEESHDELAERTGRSLQDRSVERASADRPPEALRYAQLAERLHGIDASPDALLQALGDAHRLSAQARLGGLEPDHRGLHDLARLDVATRDQARRHFRAAGAYYRLLAGRVEADDDEYGEALWLSADSFDRAGDHVNAAQAFSEFAQGFDVHPRRAEARFRHGLARQALGTYDEAAAIFSGLIEDSRDRVLGKGVGPYATMSYVPLSQCYVLDDDRRNDDEALDLLARLARGEVVRRESADYLTALIEYGSLLYQRERFTEAIEILSEGLSRLDAEQDPRADAVRFRLADVFRLEAGAMERTLQEAMPEADRRALAGARQERLQRALELFDQARESLEGRRGRLTALEEVYLRNSYLYLGSCAFDLGRFDEAVRHYSVAQERYPKDPASLAPMIQIVHAHIRRGEIAKAKAANARALRFFQTIPEEAWNDPSLPMGNREWERWRELTSRLIDGAEAPVAAVDEDPG